MPDTDLVVDHEFRVRVRQLTYFAVGSESMSPEEIERRLGVMGDRIDVKGSRGKNPVRPVEHSWRVACSESGRTIDEQIAMVLTRLQPARRALRLLVAEEAGVHASLQVVRYFDDELGEEEDLAPPVRGLEKLPGQHQLLGWHLDRAVMEFLLEVGAELDVDEYG